MDDCSFRRMAVDSAQRYFQYLVQEDKGIIMTEVSSVEKRGEEAFLHLRGHLSPAGLESLKLRIYADEFETREIVPVEYHSEHGVLVLHPLESIYKRLPSGPCQHISIISDLRFLVERVRNWYDNKDRPPIILPAQEPNVSIPLLSDMAGGMPTQEQYSAVCNVLTTPFSYVWGAPGTGKTRFVLANCVLAYLREDKQVLLTAPTNNALEQMLSGVLDVLCSCGISASCVYRFGIPSASFAAKYPDACEQRSVETRKAALTAKLDTLRQQYKSVVSYQETQAALSKTAEFVKRLDAITDEYQASSVPEHKLNFARRDVDRLQEAVDKLEESTQTLTIWLDSFPGRMARFFRPDIYSEKQSLLKSSARNLEQAMPQYAAAKQRLDQLNEAAQAAFHHYHEQLERIYIQFVDTFQTAPALESFVSPQISIEDFPAKLRTVYDAIKAKAQSIPVSDGTDINELAKRARTLKAELDRLNENREARWEGVRVWAMTMDRFIVFSNAPPTFLPSHIFMDEAAYCSLIKGYTLLSLGRPVTLLGDHAQLPPVCEMSERILNRGFCPEFLWAQSAIHLGSVFQKSEFELYEDYQHANPPSFVDLQLNTLSVTHRFGPRLSGILSDFIYSHGLTSAKSEETSIKYVHAPASRKDKKRTSSAECEAICFLAKELSDQGIDFAVLTPYKKQVARLAKAMPNHASAGRITTVHAAQGREFHTVILSVVDTTDKFFVASSNPIGRSVLNTAISRVKSSLILVLDAEYWGTQKQELIGHLLQLPNAIQIQCI